MGSSKGIIYETLREYFKEFHLEQRDITADNVKYYTWFDFEDWIELTGLRHRSLPPDFISKDNFSLSGVYPTFRLIGKNENAYINLVVDISDKSVYVFWFILTETRKGRGRIIFKNFIDRANEIGITKIECQAVTGTTKDGIKLNGSQTWGKLGFTMMFKSHGEFLRIVKDGNRNENCLHQLLFSQDGVNFWDEKILKWKGVFDVAKCSKNRRLLHFIQSFS